MRSVSMVSLVWVKYRSRVCIIISTVPQPVWYLLTLYVSSGLQIENRGRWVALLKPLLNPFSSLVITQDALISLPEAERVRMVPTGSAVWGTASWRK